MNCPDKKLRDNHRRLDGTLEIPRTSSLKLLACYFLYHFGEKPGSVRRATHGLRNLPAGIREFVLLLNRSPPHSLPGSSTRFSSESASLPAKPASDPSVSVPVCRREMDAKPIPIRFSSTPCNTLQEYLPH